MKSARYYYDEMMINYKIYQRGGVNAKSAKNRFMNAAECLAMLDEPNPFHGDISARLDAMVPIRNDVPGVEVITAFDERAIHPEGDANE